jgi:hypothetical protein
MQAVAAELSGYAGNSAASFEKILETVCFDASILKGLFNRRAYVYSAGTQARAAPETQGALVKGSR